MKFLVGLDVEAIQSYIFGVPRLREIRRGSRLLDWVNSELTKGVVTNQGGRLLLSEAGITYALVEDEATALTLEADLQALYRQHAPGVSVVCAHVPTTARLNADLDELSKSLRAKKFGKDPSAQLGLVGAMERCQLCDRGPASHKVTTYKGRQERLCASCRARAEFNTGLRGGALGELEAALLDQVREDRPDLNVIIPRTVEELLCGFEEAQAEHLEHLPAAARYVGLLVADGNRLGRRLQDANYLPGAVEVQGQALTACSAGLRRAMVRSIATAVADNFELLRRPQPLARRACLPVMPLLVGGDDAMLLFPAAGAVNVGADLISEFRRWTGADEGVNDFLGGPLSLSAGVALAHHDFPMYTLHEVAEELLREAKRTSALVLSKLGEERGTLDFWRLSSSMTGTLGAQRAALVQQEMGANGPVWRRRTCRPYVEKAPVAFPSLEDFLHCVEQLHRGQLPRRRLHRARDWFKLEPHQRDRLMKEEIDRMPPGQRAEWDRFVVGLGLSPDLFRPARPGADVVHWGDEECPILDVLELEACLA